MKKPVKIILIVTGVLLVLIAGGILFLFLSGPKKADFAELTEPRILEKEDALVLMTGFDGDPEVVIAAAYGKLFKTYFGLKGVPKGPKQPPPLARYEAFDTLFANVSAGDAKASPWRGFVAIPVPESVTSLPAEARQEPYPVRLEVLEYGAVAEIVHFGPYEEEGPAIGKLYQYITDQGYEIAGLHEEEYIKGPGVPFVSPQRYITIIRYQVRKR